MPYQSSSTAWPPSEPDDRALDTEPRATGDDRGLAMTAQVEAGALVSGGAADQERLGAVLVAALELALLAAHRLLGDLETAGGRHAEAAAHLARALELARSTSSPDERALALVALAGPPGAAGEPPAVGGPPTEPCARPVSLDAEPPPGRAECSEARGSTGGCTRSACPYCLTRW